MPIAPAIAHAPTAEDAAMDDLEKYLALPVEDNLDLDVLSWWKARDHDKRRQTRQAAAQLACWILPRWRRSI